ncbi:oxidoreductase [Deinococcus irradiatisoli]|uniref:Oxidoreductase n=1 Tax=Deinococcus irradiatisoli TaxID=2202254 RepID=A0A2Z3JGD2_9DEIO|nr:aldo/keto reductase [Deinococcus irradiatisoli]AWN21979.1 oxidoreductase [Deinococcus irradiatisoli]
MTMAHLPTLLLPGGTRVPVLGQGTWNIGDDPARRSEELRALQTGLDLGLTLIDTAEMYGNGNSEHLVGEAIRGRRDEVQLVSKVLPGHASRQGTVAACHASLRRLGTDFLDLYLLHWRGRVPLAETVEALEALRHSGDIRAWGVSNFGQGDLRELAGVSGGEQVATNQVLYNLTRRGIEFDLLPQSQQRGLPIMAYSPVEQGRLADNAVLRMVAARHGVSELQVALAWVLRQPGVIAIPKAARVSHVRENRAALDLKLTEDDLAVLDQAFPPPQRAQALEML